MFLIAFSLISSLAVGYHGRSRASLAREVQNLLEELESENRYYPEARGTSACRGGQCSTSPTRKLSGETAATCSAACTADSSCTFYSFLPESNFAAFYAKQKESPMAPQTGSANCLLFSGECMELYFNPMYMPYTFLMGRSWQLCPRGFAATPRPTRAPTPEPTPPTARPTTNPTGQPTLEPTYDPTFEPTEYPTTAKPSKPPTPPPSIVTNNCFCMSPQKGYGHAYNGIYCTKSGMTNCPDPTDMCFLDTPNSAPYGSWNLLCKAKPRVPTARPTKNAAADLATQVGVLAAGTVVAEGFKHGVGKAYKTIKEKVTGKKAEKEEAKEEKVEAHKKADEEAESNREEQQQEEDQTSESSGGEDGGESGGESASDALNQDVSEHTETAAEEKAEGYTNEDPESTGEGGEGGEGGDGDAGGDGDGALDDIGEALEDVERSVHGRSVGRVARSGDAVICFCMQPGSTGDIWCMGMPTGMTCSNLHTAHAPPYSSVAYSGNCNHNGAVFFGHWQEMCTPQAQARGLDYLDSFEIEERTARTLDAIEERLARLLGM